MLCSAVIKIQVTFILIYRCRRRFQIVYITVHRRSVAKCTMRFCPHMFSVELQAAVAVIGIIVRKTSINLDDISGSFRISIRDFKYLFCEIIRVWCVAADNIV